MIWFKHLTRARHDPFIFDLRKAFGSTGYWVYFATLEIYAEAFQPAPGWHLNVSIDFMKRELDFYHAGKMKKIFNYIRQWPNHGTPPPGPVVIEEVNANTGLAICPAALVDPKWIFDLSGNRVKLIIPSFIKIMDEYTRKRARQLGDITGQDAANGNGNGKADAGHHAKVAMIMGEIARHCETLAGLPEKKGRAFPGPAFVGLCLKDGLHPGAIRDGTDFLLHKANTLQWDTITDPFGMARGVAKSRNQYYQAFPVDTEMVKKVYGDFFNG